MALTVEALEKGITEKAAARARERAEKFVRAIDAAWKELHDGGNGLKFHYGEGRQEGAEERAKALELLQLVSDSYRYVEVKEWPTWLVEHEEKKLVAEILQATEAIQELADLKAQQE